MATRKPQDKDASLPYAALQLLAPPVRLVSAALWKVLKQRDVMQYGVVEEFVTSACETVPGLLTLRHQGKLALGLRGRLILELCNTQPDVKVIEAHLERIRAPAVPSSSSVHTMRRDVKITRTVESFHSLVHTLLTDSAEREQFFKEEFPADYGPKFDQELEKLLWEFLIRLDQLLPVPNLAQTVLWLSDAPPVLEECARAATQPQLLKVLLQHQTCLGHLESAASLPPNMGDSILASLSLPPSGKVSSNPSAGAVKSSVAQSGGTQTCDKTPFITPVIGLISNDDVPAMISSSKRKVRGAEPATSKAARSKQLEPKENLKFTLIQQREKDDGVKEGREQLKGKNNALNQGSGMKRKKPDKRESDSDDEEDDDALRVTGPGKKMISRHRRGKGDWRTDESEEDPAIYETQRYMTQLGVKTLHLPEDPSLRSIFASCLISQPRVIIKKLQVASVGGSSSSRGGKSFYKEQQHPSGKSPVIKVLTQKRANTRPTPDSQCPGLDDKENHPVLSSVSSSPSQHQSNTETLHVTRDGDDYVDDSEDEATKNFRGRLFVKRYYKTKHGTYVPTLREFWKPGMTRRALSSAGSRRR